MIFISQHHRFVKLINGFNGLKCSYGNGFLAHGDDVHSSGSGDFSPFRRRAVEEDLRDVH